MLEESDDAAGGGSAVDPAHAGHNNIRLGVLGPLVAHRGGQALALGGPKQQTVLAMLIAAAPAVVTADTIALALYGDDAPDRGRRRVQTYVSTLRSMLGDTIVRRNEGWAIALDGEAIDAVAFEEALARSVRLRADDRSRELTRALALWRGRPYEGIDAGGHLDAEVGRLEELRLHAIEQRIDADLETGAAAELVPELAALIAVHPFREGLRARHMTALYRCGRQQEALQSFQELRRLLLDELGVDPAPELRSLQQRILEQDDALLPDPEPDGEPLRGYRLLEQIGSGAFSIVWRGIQPSVDREVAIKQIRGELASRPEFIRRFEAEAQLIARVEHPHIVPLIDYWRDPDSAYLVMRWLRGGTVESSLDDGPWTLDRTVRMVRQIGDALGEAHARGVVHRDVKTANILLDEQGNAFLGDFGIALAAIDSAGPEAALSHGSPAYAAPEQLRREPLGPEADVFSLGVVLYECLVGRLPFPDATTAAEMVRRQLTEPYPTITSQRPDIAPLVDDVVARATAKSPDDRFASVLDFVDALEGANETLSRPRPGRNGPRHTLIADAVDNPYRGLRVFDEADAPNFFGRERLIDELVDRLAGVDVAARCVTVVGPSGSGKSSLVRAGLLPAVRRGRPDGADQWFVTTMIPGAQPFEALEAALLRVAVNPPSSMLHQLSDGPRGILRSIRRCLGSDSDRVLLVVDQLEELFTTAPPDRARDFLHGLTVAVRDPQSPLRVVATLRADFYDRPLADPHFAAVLKAGSVDVTPLAPDELETAIAAPAERAGFDFEPGLVARIAAEAMGQPAPLPLLQHALAELVEHRNDTTLTVAGYEELGGLAGSVPARAEELHDAGDGAERAALRRLFGRLVDPDESSIDLRRRVALADLGDDDATRQVLDRFVGARLLTLDRDPRTREPTVEVAHEALLREWPRLQTWLEEDRTLLRAIHHVAASAEAWQAGGRASSDLYRGARLETASDIAASAPDRLRSLDRDFVTASLDTADEQHRNEQARIRRLRRLVAGVAAALVLALAAGAVALQQQRRADDNAEAAAANETAAVANAELAKQRARSASARGLAAQATALADRELDTALILAANAAALEPSRSAEEGLLNVLDRAAFLESGSLFPDADELALARSSGGVTVALWGDGTLRAYDSLTDEPRGPVIEAGPTAMAESMQLSSDGSTVALRTADGVAAWDLTSGDPLVEGLMPDRPTSVPFVSTSGTYLITQSPTGAPVEVHRTDGGVGIGSVEIPGPGFALVATSSDEQLLYLTKGPPPGASGSGTTAVFALPSLDEVRPPTSLGVEAILAIPNDDGTLLAAAGALPEASLTVIDATTLQPVGPTVAIDAGRFADANWNPSSTMVAVATTAGEHTIFRPDGVAVARLSGRTGALQGWGWIDDDRYVTITDGQKMVWNLTRRSGLPRRITEGRPTGVDILRDGRIVHNVGSSLEVTEPSGQATSIDLGPELANRCGPVEAEPFGGLTVLLCRTPDADGIITASFAVVDVNRGVVVRGPIPAPADVALESIIAVSIAPEGDLIVMSGVGPVPGSAETGFLMAIDATSGDVVRPVKPFDQTVMVAARWSPDGDVLLAGGQSGRLLFVDPATWVVVDEVPTVPNGAITDITLDTEGRVAYVATERGEIWMIDIVDRVTVGSPLVGATSQFQSVSVSPDGLRVVAAGRDGNLRMWDTGTGRIIGTTLQGADAQFVRFVDDDTVVTCCDGPLLLWDVGLDDLVATACRLAGRPLSDAERALFADDLPPVDACRR